MNEASCETSLRKKMVNSKEDLELIDFFRIIWKWKYIILGGTLICAIISGFIGFKTPPTYAVKTIIKLNEIRTSVDNNEEKYDNQRKINAPLYIGSPKNIKSEIELGILNEDIKTLLKKSKDTNISSISEFTVEILGSGNLLQISQQTSDPNLGVSIMNSITPVLLTRFEDKISQLIQSKKIEMATLEDKKRLLNLEINNNEQRIVELNSDIKALTVNTDIMSKQRDELIKERNRDAGMSGFLFSDTILKNRELINTYKKDLYRHIVDKENNKIELKRLEAFIQQYQKEIKSIKNNLENTEFIQVLRPPANNIVSFKTSTTKIVASGTAIGLFMMLLIAFSADYILKTMKNH